MHFFIKKKKEKKKQKNLIDITVLFPKCLGDTIFYYNFVTNLRGGLRECRVTYYELKN
jgi:hypothetical protein